MATVTLRPPGSDSRRPEPVAQTAPALHGRFDHERDFARPVGEDPASPLGEVFRRGARVGGSSVGETPPEDLPRGVRVPGSAAPAVHHGR